MVLTAARLLLMKLINMNRFAARLRTVLTASRQGMHLLYAGTVRCAGFLGHVGSRLRRRPVAVAHRSRREEKQRRKMLRREAERTRRTSRGVRKAA